MRLKKKIILYSVIFILLVSCLAFGGVFNSNTVLTGNEYNVWLFENNGSDSAGNHPLTEVGSSVNYTTTYKVDGSSAYSPALGNYLYNDTYAYNGANSYSLSMWVKHHTGTHTGTSPDYAFTGADTGDTNADNFAFFLGTNDNYTFYIRGCNVFSNGTMDLNTNWNNIILIFNNATEKQELYLNGELIHQGSCGNIDGAAGIQRVFLGTFLKEQNTTDYYWNGVIDRVIIKDGNVFNDTEIKLLSTCGWLACDVHVEQKSPVNNTLTSSTQNFICNTTYYHQNMSNVSLYVWNSSGVEYWSETNATQGYVNTSAFDVTFNYTDNFIWGCYGVASNNENGWSDLNFTIQVDVDDPVITLETSNNTYFDRNNNVSLNCSYAGSNLGSGFMYGDFTGSYALNYTDNNISNGDTREYNVSYLDDGSYSWTCAANKSTDSTVTYSNDGNYTFTVDTLTPNLTLNSITTTQGSQSISFNFTAQDINIDSCKYTIYNGSLEIDGIYSNVSTSCSALGTATVSAYGTYTLRVYTVDYAGNENTTTDNFTTAATPAIVLEGGSGAGGGGGTSVILNVSLDIGIDQISRTILFFPNSPYIKTDTVMLYPNREIQECIVESDDFTCDIGEEKTSFLLTYTHYIDNFPNDPLYVVDSNLTIQSSGEYLRIPITYTIYNGHYYYPVQSSENIGIQETNVFKYYDETGKFRGYKLWWALLIGLALIIILIIVVYKRIQRTKTIKKIERIILLSG